MNVADLIVERLVSAGVEVVFTVPGEQLDPLFQALAESPIQVMHTRHEQAAAFMAYGYARSTGGLGVLVAISGPGVLHSAAGLALGFAGDARMLLIAGQVPRAAIGRGYGVPHEIPNQHEVLAGITALTAQIDGVEDAIVVIEQTFERLKNGRPRPVALQVPADVVGATVPAIASTAPAPESNPPAGPCAAVEPAVEAIRRARRPIGFVGSGGRHASQQIRRLAGTLRVPFASEMGGRGVLSDDDPFSISFPLAHRLWGRADLVVAIGTRFTRPLLDWGYDDSLDVIRIDIDPEEMERVTSPRLALIGDSKDIVEAMLAIAEPQQPRTAWETEKARLQVELGAELAVLQPQLAYLAAIRDALPRDGYFVDELTQIGYVSRFAFPVFEPYTYIPATYQGGLGFGFATALGVKVANPAKAVVSVSGDGGFLYTACELATAVQHRIGVVAVVFNDNCFGNIRRSHTALMGRAIATELHNPDFVAFAESFGAFGQRVDDPADLAHAVADAVRREVPSVLEVRVGEMPSPWEFIRMPRVRGVTSPSGG